MIIKIYLEEKNDKNDGGVSAGMASWESFIIAIWENIWQEYLREKTNLI